MKEYTLFVMGKSADREKELMGQPGYVPCCLMERCPRAKVYSDNDYEVEENEDSETEPMEEDRPSK
jgi:hypothetical protein